MTIINISDDNEKTQSVILYFVKNTSSCCLLLNYTLRNLNALLLELTVFRLRVNPIISDQLTLTSTVHQLSSISTSVRLPFFEKSSENIQKKREGKSNKRKIEERK